ncbi:MAG: fructosamine kinase family protein [Gemmatimonadota bacterium]|nr:fructosamine kinase family protein [Gemmatimonadota bacterium]MDH3421766.1 fructosamine kinase family protein [Gemmatimonadota bacterium]
MLLPEEVRGNVERALADLGLGRRIETSVPVAGGCINSGARIETDSGETLFLKWNPSSPPGMFEAEAEGLAALAEADVLRVPTSFAWSDEATASWLLMEFIPQGPSNHEAESALGRSLAKLHAHRGNERFGWARDNWIGSLRQRNTLSEDWGGFWREHRIEPQVAQARRAELVRYAVFDVLLDLIPGALSDVERPQLVHGDLWSGNRFVSDHGEPVLIDPAVYLGHGEVDLAMSELFGGFGEDFYDAYEDVQAIPSAYTAYRRDLYQLYYLLVHVNLFGGAYEAPALRAARRIVSEVG